MKKIQTLCNGSTMVCNVGSSHSGSKLSINNEYNCNRISSESSNTGNCPATL